MVEIKENVFVATELAERLGLIDWRAAEEEARLERERFLEWERKASSWLADPANQNSPDYSDIYKDMFGVRP